MKFYFGKNWLLLGFSILVVSCGDSSSLLPESVSQPLKVSIQHVAQGQLVFLELSEPNDPHGLTSVRWEMGDGTILSGEKVVHWFSNPGQFRVRVTATDASLQTGEAHQDLEIFPLKCEPDWQISNGATYIKNIPKFAFGPPGFVGIGAYGNIVHSRNGLNWCPASSKTSVNLIDVQWQDDAFFAFGWGNWPGPGFFNYYSYILKSHNGIDWERSIGPDLEVSQFATNGQNYLFADSQNGVVERVYVSDNGEDLQRVNLPGFNKARDIWWSLDRYFIYDNSGRIFVSPDGRNWEKSPHNSQARWNDMAGNGTVFVGVGDMIETSRDGLVWEVLDLPLIERLGMVTWGDGRFVAVGQTQGFISVDGESWESFTLPRDVDFQGFTNLSWNGKHWLIFSTGATPILWSVDGQNWVKSRGNNPHGQEALSIDVASYDSNEIILLDSLQEKVWYGPSLSELASEPLPTEMKWDGVAKGSEGYILTGREKLRFSLGDRKFFRWHNSSLTPLPSLETRFPMMIGMDGSVLNLTRNGGVFREVGGIWERISQIPLVQSGRIVKSKKVGDLILAFISSGNVIWVSPDGLDWDSLQVPVILGSPIDAAVKDGLWIVVGSRGGIAISEDRMNWETLFLPYSSKLTSITSNQRYFFLNGIHDQFLGSDNTVTFHPFFRSENGRHWIPENGPQWETEELFAGEEAIFAIGGPKLLVRKVSEK